MKPILSVVIATYNYGRFIEEAIRSVLDEELPDVELIVVDGGSTDNTNDILNKYADKIAWWCSEPDKGQSDAFNKGFSHASGKYLTWLNADDYFVKGALKRVVASMKKYPRCEWFTSNTLRFVPSGKVVEVWWGPHVIPDFLQTKSSPIAVYGPSTFFSKNVYKSLNGIRNDMHYMMDIDLWARMIQSGVKQRRLNFFTWAFRLHSDSKTAEYGEHKLSLDRRAEFEAERSAFYMRTKYHESRVVQKLILLWRVVDGSLIRAIWLRKVLPHKFACNIV